MGVITLCYSVVQMDSQQEDQRARVRSARSESSQSCAIFKQNNNPPSLFAHFFSEITCWKEQAHGLEIFESSTFETATPKLRGQVDARGSQTKDYLSFF